MSIITNATIATIAGNVRFKIDHEQQFARVSCPRQPVIRIKLVGKKYEASVRQKPTNSPIAIEPSVVKARSLEQAYRRAVRAFWEV